MGDVHGCSSRRLLQARHRPCNVPPMQDFDFAIVGAGIAGVSVAYHLAPHAQGDHPRARACAGLSHDRPLGGAALGDLRQRRDPRHHGGVGPLLSQAAGGLHRPSAADAARRADRRPRRAGSRREEGRRRLCTPGAQRALARPGRDAAPAAAAQAGSGGRRRDLRARGRRHGRGRHPRRLPEGRARRRRPCCASMPKSSALDRKDGRWTIALRDGETIARRQRHRCGRRLGRRAGRPGRLRADRAGPEAAHRLHLRLSAGPRSRARCRW